MSDFLIPALAGLDPYVPGEQPQGREYVKLNTNESPFPPSPRVLDALSREEVSRLNLYSDPTALPLRRAIADTYGLSPDNVFCGNGSDEVLGFSFLAFADGAHPVTFPAVSYGFYRVFANLFRVPTNAVPLREDFTVPVEPFLGTGGMVVLANPNAPTGISLPLAEVERIVRANPDHIVLVDEAYVDFGGESALPLLASCPNLLIVRTFSKSRSLQSIKNPSVTSRQLPFQVSKRGLAADNLCVIIAVPLSERVTHEYRSAPPVTPLPRQLKYMVGAGKATPLI